MRWAPLGAVLSLCAAHPAAAQLDSDTQRALAGAIIDGVQDSLQGKRSEAIKAFDRAEAFHPRAREVSVVRGLAYLTWGRAEAARRYLPETGPWVVYRAMAEVGTRGGLAKARGHLVRAAREPDATASVLFLTALAYEQAGQPEQADGALSRAISALDHSLCTGLAPDAGVGLADAALVALGGLMPRAEARVRLAELLLEAGRRARALDFVAQLPDDEALLARALKVRLRAYGRGAPELSREAARALTKAAPDDAEGPITLAEIGLREDDPEQARRAMAIAPDEVPARLRGRAERVRARLALITKDGERARRHARQAVRAEPESAQGRALLARALLATGEPGRASELAEDVLRRRPLDVDPFLLLADVHTAQQRPRKVRDLQLRSRAFVRALRRTELRRDRVEAVFEAVRDAEAGVGAAGLMALRDRDPDVSLPIDLALARLGRRGEARAARDRILAGCGPRLRRLLGHRGTWDELSLPHTPYGRVQSLKVPLTAANPMRCRGGTIRIGARNGGRPR